MSRRAIDWSLALQFYLPMIVFWTAVIANRVQPDILRVVFDFPPLHAGDFAVIARGREAVRDEIVFYRGDGRSYVARLIGVPGDQLTFDPFDRAIYRAGKLVVRAPPGNELRTLLSGLRIVGENEYATYVHDPKTDPSAAIISGDAIIGPLEYYIRRSEFGPTDWAWIAVSSAWMGVLLVLPFKAYFTIRPRGTFRTVLFVAHALIAVLVLGLVVAIGIAPELFNPPAWWMAPFVIVRGTGVSALLAVLVFLGLRSVMLRLRTPSASA